MANSVSLAVQSVSVLGAGDDGVQKYLIGLRLTYNEVIETPVQVEVPNPDYDPPVDPDPEDPPYEVPEFILEDQIELSYEPLFFGDYKIEAKHDPGDLETQLLAVKARIQGDIDKYKQEQELQTHNVLVSKVSQLEGLLEA